MTSLDLILGGVSSAFCGMEVSPSRAGGFHAPITETHSLKIRLPDSPLEYDPETGEITSSKNPGVAMGYITQRGYIRISVNDKDFLAHRLAWLIYYGEWPNGQIDHKNGIRSDNRIKNLRLAQPGENNQNKRVYKNNKIGLIGVSKSKGRFRAEICIDRKRKFFGTFDTAEQAHAAYIAAKSLLHHFQPSLREGAASEIAR